MSQTAAWAPSSSAARSLVPFALAGIALFGLVLDEFDVTHDNVQGISVLGLGALAGAVTGILVARGAGTSARTDRARRLAWDVVRYFLAFEMVRYGVGKIVGMQFYPQYWKLDLRAVDMQPRWLAWVFFGRSYGYQAIAGAIEIVSAVLVCFPRTTLLGACVMATALMQVVLLNFFYDVPVKLFSSVYLTLDLCLIGREAPRLWAFFLPPLRDEHTGSGGRARRAVVVALVLGLPAAATVHEAVSHHVFHRDALEGAWSVQRRVGLDDLLPETPGQWDRVYFEKGGFGFVGVAGKQRVRFEDDVNETERTLKLSTFDGHASAVLSGTFRLIDRDRLHLEGSRGGKPFSMDLTHEFPAQ